MKFKTLICLISIYVMIVIVSDAVYSFKTKSKRMNSMMEYLNTFFSEDKSHARRSEDNHVPQERHNKNYRFKEKGRSLNWRYGQPASGAAPSGSAPVPSGSAVAPPSGSAVASPVVPGSAPAGSGAPPVEGSGAAPALGPDGNPIPVDDITQPNPSRVLRGWWRILSLQYLNAARFPKVKLPSGREVDIKVDTKDNFRINPAFDSLEGDEKPPRPKSFWFRIDGINVWYTPSKTDLNVLDSFGISNIAKIDTEEIITSKKAPSTGTYCITIESRTKAFWKLCNNNRAEYVQWDCHLRFLVYPDFNYTSCMKGIKEETDADEQLTPNIKEVTQPLIIIPVPSHFCNQIWTYNKRGADWECDCADGKEQSPIDLPVIPNAIDSPVKPYFQYDEVLHTYQRVGADGQPGETENVKLQIVDGALRIFHKSFGKIITVDGALYEAEEIVFHTPSEHTINGKRFPMEMQIIHYGKSKGDISKQAILCFLFEKHPGIYNKFIDDLNIFNLPSFLAKEIDVTNNVFIPKIFFNSDYTDLVRMKAFSFYTYQGSLSAPPCTENTIVYVASKPIPLGTTALQLFEEVLRVPDLMGPDGKVISSDWTPWNNRETQPQNDRPIFHYDHTKYCGPEPDIKAPPKDPGHYEKYTKATTQYFFVNSQNPSGIPNAFLVNENEAKGLPVDLP